MTLNSSCAAPPAPQPSLQPRPLSAELAARRCSCGNQQPSPPRCFQLPSASFPASGQARGAALQLLLNREKASPNKENCQVRRQNRPGLGGSGLLRAGLLPALPAAAGFPGDSQPTPAEATASGARPRKQQQLPVPVTSVGQGEMDPAAHTLFGRRSTQTWAWFLP